MLGDYIVNEQPKSYEITLHRPDDRTDLGTIEQKENFKITKKFEGIDEIEFDVPLYIEDEQYHWQIKNPIWDDILEEYLLLVNNEQFFIIDSVVPSSDDLTKHIHACSYEDSLRSVDIVAFQGTRRLHNPNATEQDEDKERGILQLFESETHWTIGHVDSSIEYDSENLLRYRFFDIPEKEWLNFLKEDLSNAFNCIVLFDTVNKQINLYDRDTYGENTGLHIHEDNYLDKIKKEIKIDKIITRLRCYGKDNLTISSVNPLGGYVENFSYYKNEKYMSTSLITKLNVYEALIESKEIELQGLLDDINTKNSTKTQKESDLSQLKIELVQIEDQIKIAIANGTSLSTLRTQKNNKKDEIATKELQISAIDAEIETIQTSIITLKTTVNKESNFTSDEIEILQRYTKEGKWEVPTYDKPKELYEDGKKELAKRCIPPTEFSVDMKDLFESVDNYHDWDKFSLGNFINIDYEQFNILIEARLIEYTHEPKNNKLMVKFSNKNEINDTENNIASLLSQTRNFNNFVGSNKHYWNLASGNRSDIENLLYSELNTARNRVIAEKAKIFIDEFGFHAINLSDSNREVRILGDLIAFTDDGWETAKTALSSEGINGEYIIANTVKAEHIDLNTLYVGGDGGIQLADGAVISWGSINKGSSFNTDVVTITENTITAPFIATLGLEVGNQISMGINATIEWNKVNNKPTDLALVSDINWTTLANKPIDLATLSDIDWSNLGSIPTDLAKLNDIDWTKLANIPTDLAKTGDINWTNLASKPINLAYLEDIDWNNLSNIPTDLATNSFVNDAITNADYTSPLEVDGKLNTALANYVTSTALASSLAGYYTKGEMTNIMDDYLTNSELTTVLGQDYVITGKVLANNIVGGEIMGVNLKTSTSNGDYVHAQDQWIDIYTDSTRRLTLGSFQILSGKVEFPSLVFGDLPSVINAENLNNNADNYGIIYRDTYMNVLSINNKKGIELKSMGNRIEIHEIGSFVHGDIDFTNATVTGIELGGQGTCKGGIGTFTGNGGETTIPHGLGQVPSAVTANPLSNPNGYLGETWCRCDSTNIYIGNTGSYTGTFYWTAVIN